MNDKVHNGAQSVWRVLTEASIKQLDDKLFEATRMHYAEIVLVVEEGRYRFIRGPAPSDPVRQ